MHGSSLLIRNKCLLLLLIVIIVILLLFGIVLFYSMVSGRGLSPLSPDFQKGPTGKGNGETSKNRVTAVTR